MGAISPSWVIEAWRAESPRILDRALPTSTYVYILVIQYIQYTSLIITRLTTERYL